MRVERSYCEVVRIDAPEFFLDPAFLEWLNSGKRTMATWHPRGEEVGEYSDVFTWYDGGEGSDSPMSSLDGMPEHIWKQLDEKLKGEGFTSGIVWITNVEVE